MIPLDWKERLTKDSEDFFTRKIAIKDFDFDIIYNAYPERVDNKVPKEVVSFVANAIAVKMGNQVLDYIDFLDYLWYKKGENGKLAFVCIVTKLYRKKADFFLNFLSKKILESTCLIDLELLLDKCFYFMIKKDIKLHLDLLLGWFKNNNEVLHKAIIKLLVKIIKNEPGFLKPIFSKLESAWLYATPDTIKINSQFLKAISSLDKTFYLNLFENYRLTRNPAFVEILCGSLTFYNPMLDEIINAWSLSGNARLKKAALSGLKNLKRKKEAVHES